MATGGHLEKFAKHIGYSGTIKTQMVKLPNTEEDERRPYARIMISRRKIVKDLIEHGIVPNKSLVLEMPVAVPPELLRHYARGYFDGDGCLCLNGAGYWSLSITSGSPVFMQQLGALIEQNTGCAANSYVPLEGKGYVLAYSSTDKLQKIMAWFYRDATVYLDRKYEKYQLFCAQHLLENT